MQTRSLVLEASAPLGCGVQLRRLMMTLSVTRSLLRQVMALASPVAYRGHEMALESRAVLSRFSWTVKPLLRTSYLSHGGV